VIVSFEEDKARQRKKAAPKMEPQYWASVCHTGGKEPPAQRILNGTEYRTCSEDVFPIFASPLPFEPSRLGNTRAVHDSFEGSRAYAEARPWPMPRIAKATQPKKAVASASHRHCAFEDGKLSLGEFLKAPFEVAPFC